MDGKFEVSIGFTSDGGSGCGFSPEFETAEECAKWIREKAASVTPEKVTVYNLHKPSDPSTIVADLNALDRILAEAKENDAY